MSNDMRLSRPSLEQTAYEAYAEHAGWKSLATGTVRPPWSGLRTEFKEAWKAAATSVAEEVMDSNIAHVAALDALFATKIASDCMTYDKEVDHIKADELLCQMLASIGCKKSVAAFQQVGKYYA